jgi:hypothetical protein
MEIFLNEGERSGQTKLDLVEFYRTLPGISFCWKGNDMCEKSNVKGSLGVWLILLIVPAVSFAGKTIYVDDDATGANDGSSWQNAYSFLQNALADANASPKPVEIRVAQAIYRPDEDTLHPNGTGDRAATFQLINGVTIKGGYAGFGEPDPNALNIELYETILSGDLDENDVDVNESAYLLEEHTRAENSYHVVTGSGTDSNAILDGFTIIGGHANGLGLDDYGAGMYNWQGSPTVSNCSFCGNSASWCGGGMYNYRGNPTLMNCEFTRNSVSSYGGGIYNEFESNPTFINCSFTGNQAGLGAGMFNSSNSDPTLTHCTFRYNVGGQAGGGMFNHFSSPRLMNSEFTFNSAVTYEGGGVFNGNCSPTLINCTFYRNMAPQAGGMSNYHSTPTLTNCTFVYNGYVAMDDFMSNPTVTNCILWDGGDEIWDEYGSIITISYSDVQGEEGEVWPGEGNICSRPLFADSDNGDYHLKSQAGRWDPKIKTWVKDDVTSPCIDAGDPASPIGYEPFPNGGIINMGAYGGTAEASKSYFGEPVCETIVAGDINGDCKVDFKDFALMAFHWLDGG